MTEQETMSTPNSKLQCEVCDVDLLQVGERKVSCPRDDLDLSLCPGCAGEVLAQLVAQGIVHKCAVCTADLLQVGDWRTVFYPARYLELSFCLGCAGEVLDLLAARGITLRELDGALGVYEFGQGI